MLDDQHATLAGQRPSHLHEQRTARGVAPQLVCGERQHDRVDRAVAERQPARIRPLGQGAGPSPCACNGRLRHDRGVVDIERAPRRCGEQAAQHRRHLVEAGADHHPGPRREPERVADPPSRHERRPVVDRPRRTDRRHRPEDGRRRPGEQRQEQQPRRRFRGPCGCHDSRQQWECGGKGVERPVELDDPRGATAAGDHAAAPGISG